MAMQKNAFLKKLTVFSIVVALLLALVQNVQHKFVLSNLVWVALVYYFLLALATGLITNSGIKKDHKIFISRTYSAIGIRLVFSIFPLIIYLLFSPGREMPLIVTYILLYFLYTSFEIYLLVVNLRPDSEN